jgi:drug/metabolite transporter (DMT)-like permease
MKPKTLFTLAFTLLVWSSAFAAIRLSLKYYSPGALALVRFTIASLFLFAYGRVAKMRLPERGDLPMIVLCSFLGVTVYHVGLNYGSVKVPAGASAFLVNTGHIFTALLARFWLKENLRPLGWVGMAVSLAGVALLAFSKDQNKPLEFEPRSLLIVLAAASSSVYLILQRPFLRRYSPLEFSTYVIWFGTLFMFVFSGEAVEALQSAPAGATAAVIYLGIIPGALGYVGWTHVMSEMSAATAVSFLYLVPVLATAIAWAWLGEKPGVLSAAGGALALLGVVIVQRWGKPEPLPASPPDPA